MKNNRILIDANPIIPYLTTGKINGIGRTCMELISELGRQSYNLPFEINLYTQNLKGVTAAKLNTGLPCHHLYFRNTIPWNRIARALHLRELLCRYDLQHITHNYELVTDPSHCIVTVHDAMFFSYPEEFLGAEKNRKLIPPFVKKAAHVITISENSKREIMEYMDVDERKITVIPWGVNQNLLYPHNPGPNKWSGDNPYFASVSCDRGRKNTITLLRAFKEFSKNQPRHHLILVWRNPSDEALKIAKTKALKDSVHFASNLSNETLADIYAGATATFFPSLYEGFGLPIAESLACGVPCVTARNSSLEEVGGSASIYVDPMDIKALANEMEKFENGDYNLNILRANAFAKGKEFTWERCATSTIEVYKKCLGIN